MAIPLRYKFILGYALLHYLLIILGAFEVPLFREGLLKDAELFYGELTGSQTGFRFFAPNVGSEPRALFEVVDKNGNKSVQTLQRFKDHESDMKVGSILYHFEQEHEVLRGEPGEEQRQKGKNMEFPKSLAASWAGKILARNPGAKEVTVRVQAYYLPTMVEWRKGQRPFWEDFYVAKFQR